jgi:hypothetical protein
MSELKVFDNFVVENFRDGKSIWKIQGPNILTNEGLNFILQTFFGQGITTLYVGLIDLTSFTAVSLNDTAAQINGTNGWKENASYSNTTRQTYFAGTAINKSINNTAAKANFTMTGSGTIHGAFVCSSNVKSGVAGKLINAFVSNNGDQVYIAADLIQITVIYGDWGADALASNNASTVNAAVVLDANSLPAVSIPIPDTTPIVTSLPLSTDPLSVIGTYIIYNSQPYIFTAGLSGPPGYWQLSVTGTPSIRDTWANLSLYAASSYPVGTVFYATDRTVSYAVQTPGGTKTWIYYNGIYEDVMANIPVGLDAKSIGLTFRASDYLHSWVWSGSAWSLVAVGLYPGTRVYNLTVPPFGGTSQLWHACDGATVLVSQNDASLVSTVLPTIANTWYVR